MQFVIQLNYHDYLLQVTAGARPFRFVQLLCSQMKSPAVGLFPQDQSSHIVQTLGEVSRMWPFSLVTASISSA